MKKIIKEYSILMLGTLLIAFGISACIKFGWGGDPISVFYTGVSDTFNISYGTTIFIFNIVFVTTALLLDKKQVGLGTVLLMFAISPFCDYFLYIIPSFENIYDTIPYLLLSYLILGFGVSLTIFSNTGKGPYEAMIISIAEKYNQRFSNIKFIFDFIFFVLGLMLGGLFTISAIILLLILGRLIEFYLKILEKNFNI